MKKIILASTSPRRREILKKLKINFETMPSGYEEVLEEDSFTYEKIENLAFNKANFVAKEVKEDCLILGADTVVVLDNKILGKPFDENDAKSMLKKLSGKKHFVVTSICIIDNKSGRKINRSATTFVEFQNLSEEVITYYVENYKPLDKAGSYGIQELPDGYVKSIDGSLDNVIGLCSKTVIDILKEFAEF